MSSGYRIESDFPLTSDWLPAEAFTCVYPSKPAAIATAIEGIDDPEHKEVRVIDVATGKVVWRSVDDECE